MQIFDQNHGLTVCALRENFIDWRGSESAICFEDFKTSKTLLFLHFVYVRRMW